MDTANFVVERLDCGIDCMDVGVKITKGYIVCERGASFCDALLSMKELGWGTGVGIAVPWAERIAARRGFESSNVRVERAKKACKNALWLEL